MKRIFVCSPFSGKGTNLRIARMLCRAVAKLGHAAIASHVLCSQYLDDLNPEERKLGRKIGLKLLSICDELWYYDKLGITEGMKTELEAADKMGIPYRDISNFINIEELSLV